MNRLRALVKISVLWTNHFCEEGKATRVVAGLWLRTILLSSRFDCQFLLLEIKISSSVYRVSPQRFNEFRSHGTCTEIGDKGNKLN